MDDKAPSGFCSVIKRWGKPILPPLITAERREEIAEDRRLAGLVEERMNRRREERDYLKAKIRALVEKFQVLDESTAQLVKDRPSSSHSNLPHDKNVRTLPQTSTPDLITDFSSTPRENLNSPGAVVSEVRSKYSDANEKSAMNISEATNASLSSLMTGLFITSRFLTFVSTGTQIENLTTAWSNASTEGEAEPRPSSVNMSAARKHAFTKELDTTSITRTFTPVKTSLVSPSDIRISITNNECASSPSTCVSSGSKTSVSPQTVKDGKYSVERFEEFNISFTEQGENDILRPQVDKSVEFQENASSAGDASRNVRDSSSLPQAYFSANSVQVNEFQINESNSVTVHHWVEDGGSSLHNETASLEALPNSEGSESTLDDSNQLHQERSCDINENENTVAPENEVSSTHNSPTNSGSEISPSSRVMIEDSESSFHTVTPSTDLEKYMNSSAETLTSPSAPKTSERSESLDCSLVTELSSKSEDVTVINLSSGSTTPFTYEEALGNGAHERPGSVLKDVLNVGDVPNLDNANSGKPRIRHNSFTLESPSPALLKALANNVLVGPATVLPTVLDKTPSVIRDVDLPRRRRIISQLPASLPRAGELRKQLPPDPDAKSKSLASGILKYSEQQIKTLQAKHKELREYLDRMKETSSPLNPKPVFEFLHPAVDKHSEENMVIPVSSIREVMQAQEQYLDQLKQQLLEQHQRQMAELFEQQQLQWQTLTDFLQHQDGTFSENISNPILLANEKTDKMSSVRHKFSWFLSIPELRRDGVVVVPPEAMDPLMKPKFDRVSAAAKGFLTRRLMQSDRVQSIIQTIKDTVECALQLHTEFHDISEQDAILHQRLIVQLNGACHEFHDVFFALDVKEQMALIAHTRNASTEKSRKVPSAQSSPGSYLSTATLKVIARKHNTQSRVQEHRNFHRRRISSSPRCWSSTVNNRAQSCPASRSNHQSPSSWKTSCSNQSRTVSRKVRKISTKPFKP